LVYTATQLIRRAGVSGTGLRELVAEANAPWGSLQHYFPGGKDQIVDEALAWASAFAAERVERYMAASDPPTPSGLFTVMVNQWRDDLVRNDYARGCPLVAAVADVAWKNDPLCDSISRGFDTWRTPIAAALRRMGVPRARAGALSTVMLSSLEGAIVIARARRDVGPLNTVRRELNPVLDAAVRRSAS
jgi:AcrR family transcriptional regulator